MAYYMIRLACIHMWPEISTDRERFADIAEGKRATHAVGSERKKNGIDN